MTAVSLPLVRRVDWRVSRGRSLAALLAGALALYALFRNQGLLPHDGDSDVFRALNGVRDWVDENRNSSPIFLFFVNSIRLAIARLVDLFQAILDGLTWPGVTAIAGALGLVLVGWRTALLMTVGFLSFGVLGLWEPAIETLALTLAAVVLSLGIGIPLGILAGRSDRFNGLVTPFLDVMQIMPTFAYLAPMTLIFLIGPPAATVATMIYAIPPAIRITSLGIRGVPPETVEAAVSLGSTRRQVLAKVQLPMARTTIGLAVNQTIMMALSMVVITALIDAPGLGEKIIQAVERLNVGSAFDAGVAIVILAMLLDRLTARASQANDLRRRGLVAVSAARRRALVLGAAGVAVGAVLLGRAQPIGAEFPEQWAFSFRVPVNQATGWVEMNLYPITEGLKNLVTTLLLNPLETILTTAPWWLVVAVAVGLGLVISGRRAALAAAVCLLAVAGLQLWEHAMQTLATVLVGTAITLALGVALGVFAARSDRFASIMRPINDAAQTMPAFVYLPPAVALFGTTRFTAILAAVIYAAPAVIRLVEDGIRAVPLTVIEAAAAAGSTDAQVIRKVQLPMARRALLAAANQGIVLVLAMVVVGGLVGAGALGYDVVAGFAQREDFGKGLAAAISIVLLGVLLDRITHGAGGRRSIIDPLAT